MLLASRRREKKFGNDAFSRWWKKLDDCVAPTSRRQEACKFEVPDGDRSLLFGSFDHLIRLTDRAGTETGDVKKRPPPAKGAF